MKPDFVVKKKTVHKALSNISRILPILTKTVH